MKVIDEISESWGLIELRDKRRELTLTLSPICFNRRYKALLIPKRLAHWLTLPSEAWYACSIAINRLVGESD